MKTTKVLAALALFALIAIPQARASTTNYVLSISSSADYVRVPDSDSLDLIDQFTLEAWINPSFFIGGGKDQAVISKRRAASGTGFALRVAKGNLGQYVDFGMNDGKNFNGGVSAGQIQTNTWTHIAATYDGSVIKLFINGEVKDSKPVAIQLQNSAFPLTIGQEGLPGDPRPFFGLIDEVRVWNRALSQKELQTNLSLHLTGQEPGLVGYWNFDDQTPKDSSVYHNDGAFVGGAQTVEDPLVLLQIYRAVEILSLSGSASATYQLQFKTNVASSTWINHDQPFPGGQPVQFFDTARESGQKIYRVIRIR